MSKYQPVFVNIWNDVRFTSYSPEKKLLFLYLITNPMTELSGIYPISAKQIFCSTDIEIDNVNNLLRNFDSEVLEYDFEKGMVFVKKYYQYNRGKIGNPLIVNKMLVSNMHTNFHLRFWLEFGEIYQEELETLEEKVIYLVKKKNLNKNTPTFGKLHEKTKAIPESGDAYKELNLQLLQHKITSVF